MSAERSGVRSLQVSTVLQACADQVAVLGHIIPDSYKSPPGSHTVVEAGIEAVLEQHRAAQQHLKAAHEGQAEGAELTEAMQELHQSTRELNLTLQESPPSRRNLAKVQRDRRFVDQVIVDALAELQEKNTFHSLLQALEQEKKRKAHVQDIIIREEEARLRTKALQRQLVDVHKEKTMMLQGRDEMTAHLKDQLQEVKAKTSLEKKYVKNRTELLIYQGQKLNTQTEKKLEDDKRLLQEKMDEETRVHIEMESFLKDHQTSSGEKLEYWMERYDKDMENKQQELNTLKINKTNNLAQLQDLAKKYRQSEQVIIEDRMEKENLRKQLEKEQLERNAATKIQAWWRGTLVRKGLTSNKKGKKSKAKEGKKGKGKKKK